MHFLFFFFFFQAEDGIRDLYVTGVQTCALPISTAREQTVDEYGVLTRNLFTLASLDRDAIGGVIISSVVPPVNWTLTEMARIYFGKKALFVEPGVKTGMPVLVDNPLEVGA